MTKYFCIHGHFYQPPREDPWTGEVPREKSAGPFHDWNERIASESYIPCSSARILDPKGDVLKTVNLYSEMSFNFGPTLFSWIEKHAPALYQNILKADQESCRRFKGHGFAIAQAYHHIIFPLSSHRNRVTQTRWGLADFNHRFKRKAEGFWLPETAVDLDTLDVLAENKVAYTILAPSQAFRFRIKGSQQWSYTASTEIDTRRPYEVKTPSGKSIAVFFYNKHLAHDVAFAGLLKDGNRLIEKLMHSYSHTSPNDNLLVHFATDGETYGHHHHFGEMALAYAIDKIKSQNLATPISYGAFLKKYPPTYEAEIIENSAWSCAHGVERWRSDCGCHIGGGAGWNQKWRTPLREAINWLRDLLDYHFESSGKLLFKDPWAARDAYIEVLLKPTTHVKKSFIAKHARSSVAAKKKEMIWNLLEMQRHLLMTETSCGWFFDDPSGLETQQIIKYASYSLELAQKCFGLDLRNSFALRLEAVKSNQSDRDNARYFFESLSPKN